MNSCLLVVRYLSGLIVGDRRNKLKSLIFIEEEKRKEIYDLFKSKI